MGLIKYFGAIIIIIAGVVLIINLLGTENINFEAEGSGVERVSPGDHIKESQIHVTAKEVLMDIEDASWSKFTDTNSMDPVFDVGNNAIKIKPKDKSEIKMGDIISYKSEYTTSTLIHRVVKMEEDEKGWYITAKGDNNINNDPGRIRFDQVKYITVSVIY